MDKMSCRVPRRRDRRLTTAVAAAAFFWLCPYTSPVAAKVLVFAAASTSGAMDEVARSYSANDLGDVGMAFASSSTLARQIAAGAPADIFVSANVQWMDYLADKNALVPDSRRNLVGNRLVLISSSTSPLVMAPETGFPPIAALNGRPLAIGDPAHVPAGIYARAALQSLGLWQTLADHIAPMHHVRAALTLVERGEAAAGIVYATDAAASPRVSVAATFPASSHPPILYPAAIIAGNDRPEVLRFFAFLISDAAMTIFATHGFIGVPSLDP